MVKPQTYFVHFSQGYLSCPRLVMDYVTKPLAASGRFEFRDDSEVFVFGHETELGRLTVSAGIVSIRRDGEMTYLPTCKMIYYNSTDGPQQFHERNRDVYLNFIGDGGEIFPLIGLECPQVRPEAEICHMAVRLQDNMVKMGWDFSAPVLTKEASEWLKQRGEPPLPLEDLSRISRLLTKYTEANPDPNARLAVVSEGGKAVRRKFEHIATDVCDLIEIKYKKVIPGENPKWPTLEF